MRVTIEDIHKKFDALISGSESREQIADFAMHAMQENDARKLEMEPKEESGKIWKAILYFSGVDLQDDPHSYLHSIENFVEYREQIGL